ncbi:UNKNOWN [Stylonychia lemnae]|uniref:Arrestin-like N-terminal domain-containing protein n=1 Tax=Stylonychia lemnae TaxID=5949 RepID=A0A078AYV7_STYLE|nr:UNKNOWN [Stylonychia lemnae]|eukprot:CDW85973.1 UNKNOWN [Stylonychia lemnae]
MPKFIRYPSYYYTDEFRDYVQKHKIQVDKNHGYSFIQLQRDYYFPGQVVRGYALLNFFTDISAKTINIRVKGQEIPGKYSSEIKSKIKNDLEGFKDEFMTNTLNNSMMDRNDDSAIINEFSNLRNSNEVKPNRQKSWRNILMTGPQSGEASNTKSKNPSMFQKRQLTFRKDEKLEKDRTHNPTSPSHTIISPTSKDLTLGRAERRQLINQKKSSHRLDIIDSAYSLSKKKQRKKNDNNAILLFENTISAFQFKSKYIQKGQYRLPFSFQLPLNIPGTFSYVSNNGDSFIINYIMEVFIEDMPDVIYSKIEIDVREFLFTATEIDRDFQEFQQIINLRKLLAPVSSLSNRIIIDMQSAKDKCMKLTDEMRSQSLAITNNQWQLQQEIISQKCLCFQTHYYVEIHAQINKQLFYPNEQVIVNYYVDNTRNQRDIKNVSCTLTHNIQIMKGQKVMNELSFDLKLIQFSGIQRFTKQERKEFLFDLSKVFSHFPGSNQMIDIKRRKKSILRRVTIKNECNETSPGLIGAQFQRQLSRFIQNTEKFTFLSVNGISIKSSFSVDVAVTISDLFGDIKHEKKFPIQIRTPKNGQFISDFEMIGCCPQMLCTKQQIENEKFEIDPIQLPGCNFQIQLGVQKQ